MNLTKKLDNAKLEVIKSYLTELKEFIANERMSYLSDEEWQSRYNFIDLFITFLQLEIDDDFNKLGNG